MLRLSSLTDFSLLPPNFPASSFPPSPSLLSSPRNPTQAATWACRKAIESSGIDPNRIGIICNTSVWRDFLEPGMAVCIHHELGLPASCINMDVTNACVGMVNGMLTVASLIEAGVVDYALVVDAEAAEVG